MILLIFLFKPYFYPLIFKLQKNVVNNNMKTLLPSRKSKGEESGFCVGLGVERKKVSNVFFLLKKFKIFVRCLILVVG